MIGDTGLKQIKKDLLGVIQFNIDAILLYSHRIYPARDNYASYLEFNPVRIIEEKGDLKKKN